MGRKSKNRSKSKRGGGGKQQQCSPHIPGANNAGNNTAEKIANNGMEILEDGMTIIRGGDGMVMMEKALQIKARRDEMEEKFTSLSQDQENSGTTVIDETQQRQIAQVVMATFTLQMAQYGLVEEEKHSSIVYAEEHADEMFENGKEGNFFKMWEEATAKVEWEQQMREKMKKLINDGDTERQMRLLQDLMRTVDKVENDWRNEQGLPQMPANDPFHNTILDEELFHPCPPRPDCPICFLPLPEKNKICYQPCCGKTLCDGCIFTHRDTEIALGEKVRCPFCRDPAATTDMERVKKTEERLKHGDCKAFFMLGGHYYEGKPPLKRNRKKGVELFNQAAKLGSEAAHYALGMAHANGNGVKKNDEKAYYHLRLAAIGVMLEARYFLGQALVQGDPMHQKVAFKHFLIAAEAGHDESLKEVKTGYIEGHVEKDVFEKVIRAHKAAKEEVKSEAREKADKLYHREKEFIATNETCGRK